MFEEDDPNDSWAILFRPISIGYMYSLGIGQDEIEEAVRKHKKGDWGECSEAEKEANAVALEDGGCVLSIFHNTLNKKFCVLTEDVTSDRPRTKVLSFLHYNHIAR